jgi:hypothetical protein
VIGSQLIIYIWFVLLGLFTFGLFSFCFFLLFFEVVFSSYHPDARFKQI